MKKYYLILLLMVGVFVFPHFSFATNLYYQSNVGSSTFASNGGNSNGSPFMQLSNTFLDNSASGTVPAAIWFAISTSNTTGCSESVTSPSADAILAHIGDSNNNDFGTTCVTVPFISPTSSPYSGSQEWLQFIPMSGWTPQTMSQIMTSGNTPRFVGGSFGNGGAISFNWYHDLSGNTAVLFTDSTSSNPFVPPSPTISFTFPTNTTTTSDFTNWGLSYGGVTSTDIYSAQVYYQQFGSSVTYTDGVRVTGSTSGSANPVKSQSLISVGQATTSWSAYATLTDENEGIGGTVVATSSDVIFTVYTPTVGFVYPAYGTSTGLFNPWLLNVGYVNTGDTYLGTVTWVACPYGQPQGSSGCTVPLTNSSNPVAGGDLVNGNIPVTRTEWSFDFAQNETVYATAALAVTNPVTIQTTYSTSSDVFTLLSISNSSPSSSLNNGGYYYNVISTGSGTYVVTTSTGNEAINGYTCTFSDFGASVNTDFASGTWGDIECGTVETVGAIGEFLFNPPSIASNIFHDSLIQFEGLFPFDIFYSVANTLNQAALNPNFTTSTLSFTVPTDWGLVASTTIVSNGSSSTIPLLTPTLISDYAGSTFANWYFGIIDMVMWVCLGLGIWKVIF